MLQMALSTHRDEREVCTPLRGFRVYSQRVQFPRMGTSLLDCSNSVAPRRTHSVIPDTSRVGEVPGSNQTHENAPGFRVWGVVRCPPLQNRRHLTILSPPPLPTSVVRLIFQGVRLHLLSLVLYLWARSK